MLKQENVKLILHLLWEVNGINQDKNCEDERIFKSVVAKLMKNFTKISVTEYLFLWQLKGTFTKFLEQFGTNNENVKKTISINAFIPSFWRQRCILWFRLP